ncbi:hypothetical protein M3710_00160 [Mannheimia haemolytica]|uniref:hypothetical protein n=1 Tax=Mannheimia haemolytica TaxID=75985 RepID=UPI00201BBC00|nr:hypothetical protein [Mannheimia haemolytica]UQX77375.1 hypothetical protein M3710_00160 [Mannheimia haemolytica]
MWRVHTIENTPSIQTATLDTAQEIAKLSYIENLKSPEDLVQIPNSNWIIASGMTHHSGLYLIDSQTKTTQRLIAPKADKPSTQFKNSQPQPHADEMQIHGISIRAIGGGKSLLYAVNHNGFDQNIIPPNAVSVISANPARAIYALPCVKPKAKA